MKNRYFLFSFLSLFFISGKLFSQTPSWSILGTGLNGTGNAMTFYHGDLYVAGLFSSAGSVACSNIAKWDGVNWSPLGTGTNGVITAMTVYNDELYVSGTFSNAGGVAAKRIARWNGASWDSVGHGINGVYVYALEVYNGKLYAAGKFAMAGYTQVRNIASWNDTTWAALGSGISSAFSVPKVNALLSFNGKLYVGGTFDVAGTDSASYNIASWDGNNWTHTGEGFDYGVLCLSGFHGQLYAAGEFYYTTGYHVMKHLARWDGTNWNNVGGGTDDWILGMTPYGNNLYIGGWFRNAGTTSAIHIASWDGNTFSPLDVGTDTLVYSVAADEGIVYATGIFNNAGGNPAAKIAKWSNPGVGVNEISSSSTISIFPNPYNGIFSVSKNNPDSYRDGNSEIEIYNSLGEKISDIELKNETTEINISNEAKGIYFYRVMSDGKIISTGKLISE